jgi:pimeloyl-ACP methyl ester carboxylesterase
MSHSRNEPIVLIGGFGSHWADYKPVAKMLSHVSGRRVFITGINRLSWVVGGLVDYSVMIERVHKAVTHALDETHASRVMLIGHSAGGVIGRAYLGDKTIKQHHVPRNGNERVSRLVTLGSPLRAGRIEGAKRPGMKQAAWVDENYPGAYYKHVEYLSVSGRFIEGKRSGGNLREREAFDNYKWICNDGSQWGDGVVPLSLSSLDGAPHLILDGVGHSPNWGRWFFSTPETIRSWWHYFELGDAPAMEKGEVWV